ncbi:ATP-binding protein [Palleronia caenipelagi]|uniref:ATP-binding protein n=1 Tax=Palleronia caenipelagi TaxID=2489174 RepID=A0A547PPN1_9RHOB|nr:ATP-binding protein [Palleronia caenipelagi]TRD16113.1 ATP-binding protein [Palleronia caenipelagi]
MKDGPLNLDTAAASPTLEAEWQRVAALITLTEALRGGYPLPDGFEDGFAEVQTAMQVARETGAWVALRGLLTAAELNALTPFDLDILAAALAPEATPALGPRIQALQPVINRPWPGLPLVQELMMMDSAADVSVLMSRLSPTAPLITSGLLRVERAGDTLTVRASARAGRILLDRPTDPGPPPGADPVPCPDGWDALVLPDHVTARLKEFEAWISARGTVFGAWGARHVGGPMALLAGPSGVGKSFAASVLTHELGNTTGTPWALYRLDLGRIVSKYVGETEKNLNALLDALHGVNAVLQIDEADGLLGKRGDISDARDRYANLEVSHMLSRFERHDGPVILTTNLRGNIDAAFLRRFQVVVDFPPPDAHMRADLWDRLLPPAAPRDASVDISVLGEAAPLSGGGIHNAAIYAAVLAAKDGSDIGLTHIARACWRELNKESRSVRRSEIGVLADHLPEEEHR